MKHMFLAFAVALLLAPTLATAQCPGGAALRFDGINDYVEIRDAFFGGGTTSEFTVECYFKTDNLTQGSVGIWGKMSFWREANLFFYQGTVRWFYAYPYDYYSCGEGGTVTGHVWHHVAVCMAGNSQSLFVDGHLVRSAATNGMISWATDYGSSRIGCMIISGGPHFFDGWIDEMRFSSSARYSGDFAPPHAPFEVDEWTEALYHFDEGTGSMLQDASGKEHNGTLIGGPQWVCSDAPLPVELVSFGAVSSSTDIRISFSTASETDNDFFEIMRGTSEMGAFARIATLPSQGNSATGHHYEYLDREVMAGQTYWYYLADVDLNGNRTEHRELMRSATMTGSAELPSDYSLSAYPNPFNPSTTISFALPEADVVQIAVFGVTGRWIQTLVNEKRAAGNHTVAFDARELPSGVYFARMESGPFTMTKKMLLIR